MPHNLQSLVFSGVDEFHIVIQGRFQRSGAGNGSVDLWRRLRLRLGGAPEIYVFPPLEWNEDWDNLSELIWRTTKPQIPRIFIYAYSQGAGWGAVQLSKQLGRRNLRVNGLVMADPVHRDARPWMRWQVFTPIRPTIRLPRSVEPDGVVVFYQDRHWPRPSRVKTHNGMFVAGRQILLADHQYMDDLRDYHLAALNARNRWKD